MHKLIFILGKVGAGKDTLVNIFKSEYQFEPFFYADNLKAVLEMTDLPKEEQRYRVESLINEFGLQKVRKSLGIQLSGGERRQPK